MKSLSITTLWGSERSISGPFVVSYSFVDCIVWQIKSITPLTQRHKLTIVIDYFIIPSIVALFLSCSPGYITWFIVAVIINPINTMIVARSWANISKEQFKRFIPRLIKFDSAASIHFIRNRSGVIAALFNGPPCVELNRLRFWPFSFYICHVFRVCTIKIQKPPGIYSPLRGFLSTPNPE